MFETKRRISIQEQESRLVYFCKRKSKLYDPVRMQVLWGSMKDYLCLLRTSLLPLISFSLFCVRSSSDNPIIPLLYSPVSFLFLFFFCFWFGFFPPFLLYSLLLHVLLFVGYSWKSARICIPNLLFLLFPSPHPLYFLVQFLSSFFTFFFLI